GIRDGHVTGVQTCALPISKAIVFIFISTDCPISNRYPTEFRRVTIGDRTIGADKNEDNGFGVRVVEGVEGVAGQIENRREGRREIGRASCRKACRGGGTKE